MIFAKKNSIQLIIITISTSFLFLIGSCTSEYNSNNNFKEHMSDSTIGHVVVIAKRTKTVFENEPVKQNESPIFKNKQYIVDIKQSEIEWFCGKHTGFVKLKNGIFNIEEALFSEGNFTINMDSIFDTDIDNDLMRGTLDNILKSDELFDVKKFPETIFDITEVKNINGNEYSLSGNLSIKNKTNNIEFKTLIEIRGDTLNAISEQFIIDRTKWGITNMSKKYAKSEDEFIVSDSISFIVHIKAYAKYD